MVEAEKGDSYPAGNLLIISQGKVLHLQALRSYKEEKL